MRREPAPAVVMGMHAQYRGFGWTVFEGCSAPIDWGITFARGDRNEACWHHLATLLDRYRPEVLVLERPRRALGWTARLSARAGSLAKGRGIEVQQYPHAAICDALGVARGASRHQIAVKVTEHLKAFHYRLPRKRRPWDSADRRMGLFMAAAAVLTFYAQEAD